MLGNNFPRFDKYTSRTCQVEIKAIYLDMLVSITGLKTQMVLNQSMIEQNMINETQTLETYIIYLNLSAFQRQTWDPSHM